MSCSCEDHKLSANLQAEKSALQATFDTVIAVFFRRKGSLQYYYRGFVSNEPGKQHFLMTASFRSMLLYAGKRNNDHSLPSTDHVVYSSVVAAAEAAAAPNSFESLEDRQAQWEHHKSLRRNGAQSLIEDGLGPGNEAELSDHSLSSARPQQDRLTKTDKHDNENESSNQFTKFVAAYVARLDAGDSVYQIKKTLEKPKTGHSEGLIIKCRIADAENPSAFCSFEEEVVEDEEVPLEGSRGHSRLEHL
jgi:hypothetical protein